MRGAVIGFTEIAAVCGLATDPSSLGQGNRVIAFRDKPERAVATAPGAHITTALRLR